MTTSESSSFPSRVLQAAKTHRPAAITTGAVLVVGALGGAIIGLNPAITLGLVIVVVGWSLGSLAWRSRTRPRADHHSTRPVILRFALVAIATLAIIQLVPYGRTHTNPAITGEPAWATPRTRELMVDACFACHSNEVEWPWYTNIAPFSWAVTNHVNEGRDEVNYSEFGTGGGDEGDDTIEVILDGEMPPGYFTIFGLHPEAKLSDAEIDELVRGLRATPGLSEDDEDEDEDEDKDKDEDDEEEDDD